MALINGRTDQVVHTLSKQIEEHSGSLSGTVIESSMRLEDAMGRQHQGLIPISHRILRRLKSAILMSRDLPGRTSQTLVDTASVRPASDS
jgi:hypothetical protein